jgi:hypothetical protein
MTALSGAISARFSNSSAAHKARAARVKAAAHQDKAAVAPKVSAGTTGVRPPASPLPGPKTSLNAMRSHPRGLVVCGIA